MRSRLQRPPVPETPDFWDRLEAELRRRMISSPKPSRPRRRGIVRMMRPMVRPALHGAMALVAVLVVGAMGMPDRNSAPFVQSPNPVRITGWVPVVEVVDPHAPVVFYALVDRAPRFINFIESQPGESLPEAQEVSTV